jgi:hypothetical protein
MGRGEPKDRLANHSRGVMDGLALRAEAALQTGDPGKAAESLWMMLRLTEALATKGTGQGVRAQWAVLRRMATPLRTGIRGHLWRAEDLAKIAGGLRRLDVRGELKTAVEVELHFLPQWAEARRHRGRMEIPGTFDDYRPYLYEFLRLGGGHVLPAGWFDWNAAAQARGILECHKAALDPGPVRHWWLTGSRQQDDFFALRGLRSFNGAAYPVASGDLVQAAWALTRRDLLLTACALEAYYGEHRTYPPALKDLPPEPGIGIDPLDGAPFPYAVDPKDGSFKLHSKGPDGKDDGGKRRSSGGGVDWGW